MPRQVVCLVFVERNITAKVLERFIKKVCFLSHFTVSYLAGGSSSVDALTPKTQKDTLDSFRSGKVSEMYIIFFINVSLTTLDNKRNYT